MKSTDIYFLFLRFIVTLQGNKTRYSQEYAITHTQEVVDK